MPSGSLSSSGRSRSYAGRTRSCGRRPRFRRGGARPHAEVSVTVPTGVLVEYIDEHRDRFGVEPICTALTAAGTQIAPSTYYAAKKRAPSARSVSDAATLAKIVTIHAENYGV